MQYIVAGDYTDRESQGGEPLDLTSASVIYVAMRQLLLWVQRPNVGASGLGAMIGFDEGADSP